MKRGAQAVFVLISVLLAVSVLPARQDAYAADNSIRTSVEELLSSGDYAEGEAIAIVRQGASLNGEIIAHVSPETIEQTIEQTDSAQAAWPDSAWMTVTARIRYRLSPTTPGAPGISFWSFTRIPM